MKGVKLFFFLFSFKRLIGGSRGGGVFCLVCGLDRGAFLCFCIFERDGFMRMLTLWLWV